VITAAILGFFLIVAGIALRESVRTVKDTVVYSGLVRLVVRLYPADDDRRRELINERFHVPPKDRWRWLLETLDTAFWDGRQARRELAARKHAAASPGKKEGSAAGEPGESSDAEDQGLHAAETVEAATEIRAAIEAHAEIVLTDGVVEIPVEAEVIAQPTPPRPHDAPSEDRVFRVPSEDRTYRIPKDDRTYRVNGVDASRDARPTRPRQFTGAWKEQAIADRAIADRAVADRFVTGSASAHLGALSGESRRTPRNDDES
jgi:hypothetical protein